MTDENSGGLLERLCAWLKKLVGGKRNGGG